ncbi:PREDICTED: polygalacturonase inhibitor-like [Nelumbo nucifera]|uniref:Polygalacturonase inhibitor-like n=1 Tax=Nelumbo nucifera TaxID=4432 RepID=A0A1U8AFK0_NELNU|nr:PREDICTED: polygalacturonase inhibitor-like [Nelumbo nucifera]
MGSLVSLSPLLLCVLFLLSSLPSPILSASVRCNPEDYKTLMRIKKSLNNPYHLASWIPNTDCCNWYCVECDDNTNRITQFTIFQSNLSGQIPAAVGDLPYLDTVVFRKLPNLYGSIPSSITKLQNLKMLRLSWNNLSGPIPGFLGQLKNLEYLDLAFNRFSGQIPASLADLSKLAALHLDRNRLTGAIPDSFGRFKVDTQKSLYSGFYLYLSHNQLSGVIPKSLGEVNLITVDVSRNKLVGDASVLFNPNGTTQTIDLSRNQFDFDLSGVKFPKTLIDLELSHNIIRGSIPEEITGLELLQGLNVSYNRLCGQIPVGGNMNRFGYDSFFHNRCLCGQPLPNCK